MDRKELKETCQELAKVGDARAVATLRVITDLEKAEETIGNAKYILGRVAATMTLVPTLIPDPPSATVARADTGLSDKIQSLANNLEIGKVAKGLLNEAATVEREAACQESSGGSEAPVPASGPQGSAGERHLPPGTVGDVPQV